MLFRLLYISKEFTVRYHEAFLAADGMNTVRYNSPTHDDYRTIHPTIATQSAFNQRAILLSCKGK